MPYSKEQLELQAHIEAENAKRKLETEKNGGFCFTTVSDLDHWAEYDVFNIAQYNHHNAAATHYDFYKEVHGIRPHWYDYSKMTVEQIEDEIQLLVKHQEYELEIERQFKEAEKEAHQQRIKANAYKPNNVFEDLKSMMQS